MRPFLEKIPFLSAALFLSVCPAFGKTLTIAMNQAPVVLDWTTQATITESPVILNTQEGLFKYDYASQKLIPGIASEVKKSKDLKEYTFTIRKDAKWSDGRQIYAQDFVYGWLRAFSSQSTSIYTYYFFNILNAKEYNSKQIENASDVGIKAINDTTLVVKLKNPDPQWEVRTAFWPFFPARKDLVEKFGSNWWRPGVTVSSGPFLIDSYEAGVKMVLKRNPFYPHPNSNVDEIDLIYISDFDVAFKDYENKKVDLLNYIPYKKLGALGKRKDIITAPLLRVYAFGFNAERFPVNNKKFRLALLKAIDRKQLVPGSESHLKYVESLIPPPLEGSQDAIPLTFDLKAAKALLKESGIILSPKLKIQIISLQTEPSISLAKAVQSQLIKNLGITVEINALEGEEYTTYFALGEYNAFITTWTAKIKNSVDFLLLYAGFSTNNRPHYFNNTYDDFLEQAMESDSPKEQQRLYKKAQKLLTTDEGVVIPVCTEKAYALMHSSVKDIYYDQMGVPHLSDAKIQP